MPRIIVPISNGFEEIETISIIDAWRRRANPMSTIAAIENIKQLSTQYKIEADIMIENVSSTDFDDCTSGGLQMLLHLLIIFMYQKLKPV